MLLSIVCDVFFHQSKVINFSHLSSLFLNRPSVSWIWTTLLSYQLHSIFNTGKLAMEEWHMHAVSWSISLASTLLPLSTNQFGRGDGLIGWCFLVGESEPLIFWIIFSFFIIMVVCLILMTYFSVRIFLKYRHMDIGTQFPEVRAVVDSVKLYPIAMILNWTPNLIASTIFNFSSLPATRLFVLIMVITQVLSTQNGVWSAIIFFYKSKEARHRWANFFHWFQPKYDSLLVNVTPEDFPDDSVFSVSTIGEGEDTPVADRVGSDAFVFRPKTLDSDTSSDMGMHRIHSSSRSSSIAASPSIAPCVDWPRGSTTGDFSSVYNDRFAFATSHSHSVDRINTSILHEDLYSPLQG